MYQRKQTRKDYKLTVEFVNGYLTSIALLKDSINRYLSHDYFFNKVDKKEKELKDVVIGEIKNTLENFYAQNPSWTYDKELYEKQFKNSMNLQIQTDWKQSIKSNGKIWLSLYSQDIKINLPNKDCFVVNFTEIIEDLFKDEKFEMYLITGEIINDLSHHWGGIGFQDFIFETQEHVYFLHFDYCD